MSKRIAHTEKAAKNIARAGVNALVATVRGQTFSTALMVDATLCILGTWLKREQELLAAAEPRSSALQIARQGNPSTASICSEPISTL